MKIGILTFHSQLNYGGVLQAYALQNALMRILNEKCRMKNEKCGEREKRARDEVVVIDRWLAPDNWHLERGYNHYTLRLWIRFWLRVITGGGDFAFFLRCLRTKRFLHTRLRLTPYHFYDWSEIRNSSFFISHFSFDSIVVGSDQVWHAGDFGDPRPYLLENAPKVRAIAYAASFGLKTLPPGIDYAAGFKRFAAISVREAEAVKLVESEGSKATHVVDPTLLLPREAWSALGVFKKRPRHVVCYFLGVDAASQLPILTAWAKRTNRRVTILCDGGALKPFPKSPRQILSRIGNMLRASFSAEPVRLAVSSGPREFYRAFAEADECITDSFHAVMFSYICNCNARFLRPASAFRAAMFSRIEEFASSCIRGNFIADNLPAALASLDGDPRIEFDEGAIASRRNFSRDWLQMNLRP